MKIMIALFILPFHLLAGTITFIGPCHEEPIVIHQVAEVEDQSVGKVTIEVLKDLSIPFIGAERGINSIFDTPTGTDAYEIIDRNEMLAYGWCFSVNGFEPNLFPNEVFLHEEDHIEWWFGYAHYKDGEWIAQCTPSHLRRSPKFCD